jgi:hypothetical protein
MPNTPPAELHFAAQWILDEYPACPEGLVFLRQLSEDAPRLYTIAERHGFCDPPDEELRVHPLWLAFVDHYAHCGNCNEV